MFDYRHKLPLSGIRKYHRGEPLERLFGEGITEESLNDNALARNLDSISNSGIEELFRRCSDQIIGKYGLQSAVKHLDSTNYSVFSLAGDDGSGAAFPAYCGHAKDSRDHLKQYEAATVTNGNRILEYCRAHNGNAADCVMDGDALEFLEKHSSGEDIIVGDCKLITSASVSKMASMGVGFVSKLPEGFSERIRDTIVRSAMAGDMDVSSLEGYEVYDTESDTAHGKLRFIAFRSPKSMKRSLDYLEKQGGKEAVKRFSRFSKLRFHCRPDAEDEIGRVMGTHIGSAYRATCSVRSIETVPKRPGRGRPRSDEKPPEPVVEWAVDVDLAYDPALAEELAKEHGMQVLVTNLPFSTDPENTDIRHGATADQVLGLYLDQYKVEHTYRLMKSGMGVDEVFVHTPSRANALLFVVAIATLIQSVIEALIRRSGFRYGTFKQVKDVVHGSMLMVDGDGVRLEGLDGCEVFGELLDAIGFDPDQLIPD